MTITGLNDVQSLKNVEVFHAGTALKDNTVVTSGGRVLGVTALGNDIEEALGSAYNAVSRIHWRGPTTEKISVEKHSTEVGKFLICSS
jgi:phosphoribosylamine--glycine ligase